MSAVIMVQQPEVVHTQEMLKNNASPQNKSSCSGGSAWFMVKSAMKETYRFSMFKKKVKKDTEQPANVSNGNYESSTKKFTAAKELVQKSILFKIYPVISQRYAVKEVNLMANNALPKLGVCDLSKATVYSMADTKSLVEVIMGQSNLSAVNLTIRASDCVKQGVIPILTSEGCGGAYFIQSSSDGMNDYFAIFKPRDEEYMAPKNPRGYISERAIVGQTQHPVQKGFLIGNGALREAAAYLMDEAYNNFSGVPVTNMAKLPINKVLKEGSIQQFVKSESSAEDMGTLHFSIQEVQKIGILDIRLFNTDRHGGNILLTGKDAQGKYMMTPIDHGFTLPSWQHLDAACFEWVNWSQAQLPFTCEALDHIASLDESKDAQLLRSIGIHEDCITTMRMCTVMLKKGAAKGFSMHDIGRYLQREGAGTEKSEFETIVSTAADKIKASGLCENDSKSFGNALVSLVTESMDVLFVRNRKSKVRSISCF